METFLIFVHFPADDGLGCLGFAAAIGEVGCGDLLKIVDVVDEATFYFVHPWVDVAGDGDVDEEHWAVAAAVKEMLTVGAAEYLLRRSGGSDDDVGTRSLGVEVIEGQGFGMDSGTGKVSRDFLSARLSAVGDENGGGAVLD